MHNTYIQYVHKEEKKTLPLLTLAKDAIFFVPLTLEMFGVSHL